MDSSRGTGVPVFELITYVPFGSARTKNEISLDFVFPVGLTLPPSKRPQKIKLLSKAQKAYNLTVADFHTYFVAANEDASPVWVHNRCFTISTLAPDWATKGAHVKVNGVEIAVKPNGSGGVIFTEVFSKDAGTQALSDAIKKMNASMGSLDDVRKLQNTVERGITYLQGLNHPSAAGKQAELSFLNTALKNIINGLN